MTQGEGVEDVEGMTVVCYFIVVLDDDRIIS